MCAIPWPGSFGVNVIARNDSHAPRPPSYPATLFQDAGIEGVPASHVRVVKTDQTRTTAPDGGVCFDQNPGAVARPDLAWPPTREPSRTQWSFGAVVRGSSAAQCRRHPMSRLFLTFGRVRSEALQEGLSEKSVMLHLGSTTHMPKTQALQHFRHLDKPFFTTSG